MTLSPQAAARLDLEAPPRTGREWLSQLTPASAAALTDALDRARSDGAAFELPLQWSHPRRPPMAVLCRGLAAGTGAEAAVSGTLEPEPRPDHLARSPPHLSSAYLQAAPIAVIVLDEGNAVRCWNQAAERLLGWTAAEMAAAHEQPGAPQQRLLSELRQHADTEARHRRQADAVRKDGTLAELSVWSITCEAETGAGRHTIVCAVDDSASRRAQRAMGEQEQRLLGALSASRTGTFRWNIRSNLLQWDQNLDRLFGSGRTPPMQGLQPMLDRLHPDDREAVKQQLQHCARDGADLGMDLRVLDADGGVRWLYVVGQTFCGRDGLADYMTGAAVDITHRKRAEEALRESEARFRTLADNIAQFAWMADGEGWIFWYNQRWFDYTGTSLEQMQGWGWRQVHHPDHVDRVVQKISECFASGTAWEDTFPLRGADGNYRWFLSRAIPIRDQDGQVSRWFGTNTDITERREMEEALREADRRKDAFLATLAHELRNPLTPMVNGLELLRLFSDDPLKSRQIRATMERQTGHLVRLVDDLLEVSRISRNKVQLRLEPVDLREVMESAVETVAPLIEEMGHRLDVHLPQQPLQLQADATRLAQVFANLLHNAAKYTDPGGQLQVRAELTETGLAVRFLDNGIGIESAMLEPIFDLFTQFSASESGRGGLGIGLTLVRALVELHGGTVAAHSRGRGCGSEFVVTLPLPQDRFEFHAEHDAGNNDMTPNTPQRILVVDDNEDAAISTAMLLEAIGSEVRTAYDGEEALSVASDFQPQVILLDLGMPRLNGYEAARRLRQESWSKNMVLIALTGWGQDQDRQRTRDAGFDHHLVKPVDPAALRALLAQISADTPAG